VVIDNRPGGGGNVALQAVARAPADGYSLLLVATPHAVNVTLYEKSAVTVTRDIVPVASINTDSFVLLVNPSFRPEPSPSSSPMRRTIRARSTWLRAGPET